MEEKKGLLPKKEEEPWRVLEFYSGIGGMVINATPSTPALISTDRCLHRQVMFFFLCFVRDIHLWRLVSMQK